MRRNDDLIRMLLLHIERLHEGETIRGKDVSPIGEPDNIVGEHLRLITEAGLIRGNFTRYVQDTFIKPGHFHIDGLSWQGHEFLSAVRDDKVWSETKKRVSHVGGSVSIATLSEVAGAIAKGFLGLPG